MYNTAKYKFSYYEAEGMDNNGAFCCFQMSQIINRILKWTKMQTFHFIYKDY